MGYHAVLCSEPPAWWMCDGDKEVVASGKGHWPRKPARGSVTPLVSAADAEQYPESIRGLGSRLGRPAFHLRIEESACWVDECVRQLTSFPLSP